MAEAGDDDAEPPGFGATAHEVNEIARKFEAAAKARCTGLNPAPSRVKTFQSAGPNYPCCRLPLENVVPPRQGSFAQATLLHPNYAGR